MLLKEQALKRIKLQKREHRRTKSLDESWSGDETGRGGGRNDKITDKDKEKLRGSGDEAEERLDASSPAQTSYAPPSRGKETTATTTTTTSSRSEQPSPSPRPASAAARHGDPHPGSGHQHHEGRESSRAYLYLASWLDRDKEAKEQPQGSRAGWGEKEGFLAGYARLKQHYAAKLQLQQPMPADATYEGEALTGPSGEWGATGEEAGFTYYYDLSPTAKV